MSERQATLKEYPFTREGLKRIVLRQLQVQDDVEVGIRVDACVKNDPRGAKMTYASYLALQKREAVRLSIVAVLRDGETMFERVNLDEPFSEMTSWLDTSYALLLEMHADLNFITEEADFRKGAINRSPAEVAAMIGRAPSGPTAQVAPGRDEPDGG